MEGFDDVSHCYCERESDGHIRLLASIQYKQRILCLEIEVIKECFLDYEVDSSRQPNQVDDCEIPRKR